MKTFIKFIATAILLGAACIPMNAEESSIDDAIEMMKKTSAAYLKGEFTKIDATGIDQYVDVEIVSVHSFSDFSFGAILPFFESYLNSKVLTPQFGSSQIEAENKRILEYAKDNMTEIASYAAIVDYNGITKYHEKVSLSRLFFFDWTGRLIAIRNSDFERGEYAAKLPEVMERRIVMELSQQYDPLFLPFETYVSDTKTSKLGKTEYEMTWCYELFRDKPKDEWPRKGKAIIKYYQVQKDMLTSKSVTYIVCQYEWNKDKIEFSYSTADVSLFLVSPEYVASYDPGNFDSMKEEQLSFSIINTPTVKKRVRASSNEPKVFMPEGDSFKMSDIFGNNVFTFRLERETKW